MSGWMGEYKVKPPKIVIDDPLKDVPGTYVNEKGIIIIPNEAILNRRLRKGEIRETTMLNGAINKDTAVAMQLRGRELAKQRAAEGMMAAVNERLAEKKLPQVNVTPDALFHVVKHATGVFMDSKSPKGMSDLGAFITKTSGFNEEKDKGNSGGGGVSATLQNALTFLQIKKLAKELKEDKNIIDAQFQSE
jgi:hypothetical protein